MELRYKLINVNINNLNDYSQVVCFTNAGYLYHDIKMNSEKEAQTALLSTVRSILFIKEKSWQIAIFLLQDLKNILNKEKLKGVQK